jgi:hypothetical protein
MVVGDTVHDVSKKEQKPPPAPASPKPVVLPREPSLISKNKEKGKGPHGRGEKR